MSADLDREFLAEIRALAWGLPGDQRRVSLGTVGLNAIRNLLRLLDAAKLETVEQRRAASEVLARKVNALEHIAVVHRRHDGSKPTVKYLQDFAREAAGLDASAQSLAPVAGERSEETGS